MKAIHYLSLKDVRTNVCPKCGELSTMTEILMTGNLPNGEPAGWYISLRNVDQCPKCHEKSLEMLSLVGHDRRTYTNKCEMIADINELVKAGYIVENIEGLD